MRGEGTYNPAEQSQGIPRVASISSRAMSFWILDCGFWISGMGRLRFQSEIQNPQPKIGREVFK
jgi:hypothetical protein